MTFTVEIPDILVRSLHLTEQDVSEQALVKYVVDAYCAGDISHRKVGELLGKNYWETEVFLVEHRAVQDFDAEEYAASVESVMELLKAEK